MGDFDWEAFDDTVAHALIAALVGRQGHLVALAALYAERDGVIRAPLLYVNTDGQGFESPPDWSSGPEEWLPDDVTDRLTRYACSGSVAHWDATFARFDEALARACIAAATNTGLPVCYLDEDDPERTLGRTLTPVQIAHFFPEVTAAQKERDQVHRMSRKSRVAYLVSRLRRNGPMDAGEVTRRVVTAGAASIPLLLPQLRDPDEAPQAARLLAEIGIPDPAALAALTFALRDLPPDSPAQLWACRALARLGALHVVLQNPSISIEARATAVAANFTAFRDRAHRNLALDYRPLEDALDQPELSAALASELSPGSGYCSIAPAEVTTALQGTSSRHALVRKHATSVLGRRELEDPRIDPRLRWVAGEDPDPDVRRLAGLALTRRRADAEG